MGSGKTTSCPICFAELALAEQCMTPRCVSRRPKAVAPPPAPIHEWPHIQQANVPFALALEHMKSHPAVRYKMTAAPAAGGVGTGCDYFRWNHVQGSLYVKEGSYEHGDFYHQLPAKWNEDAVCTRIA